MTEVGFAVIQGHGVAPEVITDLRDGAHSFFTEDASVKNAFNYDSYFCIITTVTTIYFNVGRLSIALQLVCGIKKPSH